MSNLYMPNDRQNPMEGSLEDGEEEMSNCCSAKVYNPSGEDAICLDCKEHCDVVKGE